MICMQTLAGAQAVRNALNTETFRGFKTIFFDAPQAPQGYLIEQDAHWHLNTHFHLQHQFQVVARGSGTLGNHALGTFDVHYASPEAAYGPIVAGPEGLWYFTLRAVSDTGSWHLPKHRDKLRPGLRRKHALGHAGATPADLPVPAQAVVDTVIAPTDSGPAAWMLRVPAGQRFEPAPDRSGVGRFYLVARGGLLHDGALLPPLSLLFVSADESDFALTAGADGLEAVALQFPVGSLVV